MKNNSKPSISKLYLAIFCIFISGIFAAETLILNLTKLSLIVLILATGAEFIAGLWNLSTFVAEYAIAKTNEGIDMFAKKLTENLAKQHQDEQVDMGNENEKI